MSKIQELIVQLNRTTEESERLSMTEQLVVLLRTQEQLWGAFCPATKHYFLAQEQNHITAYIFSEQESYESFSIEMRKKHIILEKIENKAQHRMFLFAELYRCGVTQIVIDSEQEHATVALNSLVAIPDYTELPLVQRPVLNPTVTGKILCLMQDVRFGRANGNMELDVLQEIYHSAFLQPVKLQTEQSPEEAGTYQLPDGKKLFMIFTDLYSLKQANPEAYPGAKIARFGDLQQLLASHPEMTGIIINPGSGSAMLLDAQLLEIAEKSASGVLDNIMVKNLNENAGKVIITKPEITPHDMIQHVSAVLQESISVKTAYLRNIRKEEDIRPHFLMILDWSGTVTKEEKSEIRKKITEAALPYARGLDIEYISYDSAVGKEWAGNAEPFYQMQKPDTPEKEKKPKKRFGFFRK